MDELEIKKAIKGSKDCFAKAVLEIKDEAYRIAYCYLHNEEDSMDAVCDAVEKALINVSSLREPKFFKTWFIRIVINQCKLQLIQKKRVITLADELYPKVVSLPSREDERMDLEKLLAQLDPLERLLIYMKYYLDYTLDEIADTVNLPSGTVKSKIYRSLKMMKEKFEVKEGHYEGLY